MIIYIPKRRLLILATILVLVLAGLTLGKSLIFERSHRAIVTLLNFNRKVPIYCVETVDKRIAISFDAAWGADSTDEIISILQDYDIRTTFFLVAFWIEKYPDVAGRITAAGHEIGNHSATHPHMNSLSAQEMKTEIETTHQLIKKVTGQEASLFRAPFGEYNNLLLETLEEMNYYGIQWDVDSLDWRDVTAEDIIQRVTSRIGPGSIVLFHNNAEATPAALRPILDYCREEGYEVVPISELLLTGDYYIDKSNGMMRPR